MPSTADITERLDALEARLPTVPAKVLRFQRTLAAANYDRTTATVQAVVDSYRTFFESVLDANRTIIGQTRAAVEQLFTALRTAITTIAGQTGAQVRKVSDTAQSEVTSLVDRARDAVDDAPGTGTPYEQWTKADLVDRAKELKITGPTRMSKDDLIKALRAA